MNVKNLKIGELASATGCLVATVRFYEREGLLAPPARSSGNYRLYGAAHVERLAFIRHCRALDMTLDEIGLLLHFKDAPEENCGEVNTLLDRHIAGIANRIAGLQSLQGQMTALRAQCGKARAAKHCGILQGLASAGER